MPKRFYQLKSGQKPIVAFDDKTRKYYELKMKEIALKSFSDEEIFELVSSISKGESVGEVVEPK
jgi:hypothetical protein